MSLAPLTKWNLEIHFKTLAVLCIEADLQQLIRNVACLAMLLRAKVKSNGSGRGVLSCII